jgi:thiamine-phosphate pyrophosphorylase
MSLRLPRIYPIADAELLAQAQLPLQAFVSELHAAGMRFMQYRDKATNPANFLTNARALRSSLPTDAKLIINDRADICALSNCDGLHIGQHDLSPAGARPVIGTDRILGISTHNPAQLALADATDADYVAIGPVFSTTSKANPDPVIGLEGVRLARTLTGKPLIAIGGITLTNARSVIDAGADSIAVISALVPGRHGESARKLAEDFLALLL